LTEPMSFADLIGKKVAVWGLGKEGVASYFRLKSLNISPLLVDRTSPEQIEALKGETFDFYCLENSDMSFLSEYEVIIKSPGISRYLQEVKDLEHFGVKVVGGMGLFFEETDKKNTIMVTGTKGKSTTTSLITHLLNKFGESARAFGNLGFVPWDMAAQSDPVKWKVFEVSSFQVCDLWSGSPTTVITSLSPDHLDWHDHSVETYYRDKLRLAKLPGVKRVIANGDDKNLIEHKHLLPADTILINYEKYLNRKWLEAIELEGIYNKRNAILAIEAIKRSGIDITEDESQLEEALKSFSPLPHRMEKIAEVDGIEFIDDGLATNALPTVAALGNYFDRPVALIAGGSDRGIDYNVLAETIHRRINPICLLTLPDVGYRISQAVLSYDQKGTVRSPDRASFANSNGAKIEILSCATIALAVRAGFAWAKEVQREKTSGDAEVKGPIILLSPAAPSFSQYNNYEERSQDFRDQVMDLSQSERIL